MKTRFGRVFIVGHPALVAPRDRLASRGVQNTVGVLPNRGADQKCFFANALPEPVFKYRSNLNALSRSSNAIWAASFHGRCLAEMAVIHHAVIPSKGRSR